MANDQTVDQQQLQSTIDELYRRLSELFPAQRDALRNALNTIQVGQNQSLGMLAAADDLASAPVGNAATLRDAIGLGNISTLDVSRDGSRFSKAVFVRGDGVLQVGRYIDFFLSNDSTSNNDGRLEVRPSGELLWNRNNITTTGSATAVGVFSFLRTSQDLGMGQIVSGSSLNRSSSAGNVGGQESGTWRCQGSVAAGNATVFQKIS